MTMRICYADTVLPSRCLMGALALLLTLSSAAPLSAGSFKAEDAKVQELISYLEDEQWKNRLVALAEIESRKVVQAVDKVVELAKVDVHYKVRLEALHVLVGMESSWLVPTAEHMVAEDPVVANRREALGVIEKLGEGSRSGMVLGTVIARDSDSEMRESAARLLREKQWTGAEEQLARAALRDGAVRVRRECRRALALVGGEESRPVLHRVLLAEPNKKYRLEVAELLEGAPIPMDRGPLLGALDDPYTKIAMAAARGLARLGDKSVAAILRKKALESKSRAVAEEFNQAAATLGG